MIERTNESIRPVDLLRALQRTKPLDTPTITPLEWKRACAPVLNRLPCDAADALRYNHEAMSKIEFKEAR